jgi:hypothetical protein
VFGPLVTGVPLLQKECQAVPVGYQQVEAEVNQRRAGFEERHLYRERRPLAGLVAAPGEVLSHLPKTTLGLGGRGGSEVMQVYRHRRRLRQHPLHPFSGHHRPQHVVVFNQPLPGSTEALHVEVSHLKLQVLVTPDRVLR